MTKVEPAQEARVMVGCCFDSEGDVKRPLPLAFSTLWRHAYMYMYIHVYMYYIYYVHVLFEDCVILLQ